MTDHITRTDGVPALDYEAVKDYFFHKLEEDRFGRGRMESALYHTAQWIFAQGCARHDEMRDHRDELLEALKRASESLGRFVSDEGWKQSDMDCMDNADAIIAKVEAGNA